jgi:protein SMG6
METFQECGVQMLREFRALLQQTPLPVNQTRLLQLLALNMFAVSNTQLKGREQQQQQFDPPNRRKLPSPP